MPVISFIGLGSNLENPQQQVSTAFKALSALPQTKLEAQSALYRSKAVGPGKQPDYINAVAKLSTSLNPEQLLCELQAIEQQHHRLRLERWGPRTLDLDILTYGKQVINSENLCIPHPGITERNFVLYPLAELDSELYLPGFGPIKELLAKTDREGLAQLTPEENAADEN